MKVPLKAKYKGKTFYAWIDEEDYGRCIQYKWRAIKMGERVYFQAHKRGKQVYLHRLLLNLNDDDKRDGDHIDRDTLNNTKSNLRMVTRSTNLRNRVLVKPSTSKFPGVTWDKARHKWVAQIKSNYKNKFLGRFALEEMAAKAYRDAALQLDPLLDFEVWKELK